MERSADVEAVIRDWFHAMSKGDAAAADGLLSRDQVRMVGTDPEEWWGPDRDEVSRLLTTQVGEMGGAVHVEPLDLEGFAEGDIGWAAARPRITTPEGSMDARLTSVLRREDGQWRVVQGHMSFGAGNSETFGHELTTA